MAILNPDTIRKIKDIQRMIPSRVPFTGSTFCPRLWNSVFITAKGEIFTCCRNVPIPSFGNLHRTPLKKAWNSGSARFWRRMSIHGGLYCFDKCHLLSREERETVYDPALHPFENPYENLKNVTLLFGEFCNISCIMCDQNHRSKVMLSAALIEKQIDWQGVECVNIQGGEPLAMKECKRAYLHITETEGKKVNFLTNGMLINDKWADKIARNSLRITVSLNAVDKETHEQVNLRSNWERVIDNCKRLINARNRLRTDLCIIAHFTMVKENLTQVPDFIGLSEALGFDEVNYGFDNCIPDHLRAHPEIRDDLRKRSRAALGAAGIKVDTRQFVRLGFL